MIQHLFKFTKDCLEQQKKLTLHWYERDGLLTYYNQLKLDEFIQNSDDWLNKVEVINFNIIYHRCRGDH